MVNAIRLGEIKLDYSLLTACWMRAGWSGGVREFVRSAGRSRIACTPLTFWLVSCHATPTGVSGPSVPCDQRDAHAVSLSRAQTVPRTRRCPGSENITCRRLQLDASLFRWLRVCMFMHHCSCRLISLSSLSIKTKKFHVSQRANLTLLNLKAISDYLDPREIFYHLFEN